MNEDLVRYAVWNAAQSPCAKSKRGVVIFNPATPVTPIAAAWNGPPFPFVCGRNGFCREACNKVAVHAEERALLKAGRLASRADLLHIKVVDGAPVPSGGPSCWQCSRALVEAKIAGVWLLHEDGWRRYEAVEFHRLTLVANGLPVRR